eukprot:GHVU01041306.1.p1 GENE.GHVU01041306.1~~GHVU01041306.1.p1  ORF type:complete len:142 (-),score=10.58 GHVU01041306.1:98-523(-)
MWCCQFCRGCVWGFYPQLSTLTRRSRRPVFAAAARWLAGLPAPPRPTISCSSTSCFPPPPPRRSFDAESHVEQRGEMKPAKYAEKTGKDNSTVAKTGASARIDESKQPEDAEKPVLQDPTRESSPSTQSGGKSKSSLHDVS